MTPNKPSRHPMAEAMEWVGRITAVTLIMILPGILGGWLDHKCQTEFLTLVGFAIGVPGGIAYLLLMTSQANRKR